MARATLTKSGVSTAILCPRLALALSAVIVGACAAGPDYVSPDYAPAESLELVDGDALSSAAPELDWWQSLDDPVLTELVELSLRHNHDLRIAAANLARARALLREGGLLRFPIVDSTASATRSRAAEIARFPGASDIQEVYDASLDMSWELDFFGRVRRSVQALEADYAAAVALQRAAQVRIAAEVGSAYVAYRGAELRLRVAGRNADNQRETYELTEALLEGGRGTALDIARAEAQLESTLASIPLLEAERDVALHRIGVLSGVAPDARAALLAAGGDVPSGPTVVAVGSVDAMLRRRPDVAAAERSLAAATARIGVDVADLFPRVTLTGSVGRSATSLDELDAAGAETFSIGPVLSWAAFDLGRVRARIAGAEARADGALAEYERTVLEALRELEDALAAYRRNVAARNRFAAATRASREAARLSRLRFRGGADSFLTVLDAERRLLEAEDQLASIEVELAASRIAIYKALAGGWPDRPVASP